MSTRLSIGSFSAQTLTPAIALAAALTLGAQQLPEAPGRAELEKICKGCHEMERSVSKRQDRNGWMQTMMKMTALGMKSTEQEFAAVLDYLVKHFPADELPPVNINQARAIELESRLSLKRSEAAAILAYRAKNGPFKSLEDLKKVPNIDVAKIEAKKDKIVF